MADVGKAKACLLQGLDIARISQFVDNENPRPAITNEMANKGGPDEPIKPAPPVTMNRLFIIGELRTRGRHMAILL